MGQALYRKYRSKSLSEVVGQEHVTTTLQNALKRGSVSHAYLFTGPRGVGKTSVARILAHAVNGLPYDNKSSHLDIIEIDAASNRRIDEIRELRERIGNAPTSAKYKVYIIDEVHMLTKEAFNALLKTLEEPPEHVIFILATTEAHKLPETIVSRTQRFTFKPIDTKKAVKHLAQIAKAEGVKASDEALELIARHGEGSFRDSISLLDQAVASGKEINAELVRTILGEVPEEALKQLLENMTTGQTSGVVSTLRQLKEQGVSPEALARQIAGAIRAQLIERNQLFGTDTTKLLGRLIEIPASHDPAALLEITLIEPALRSPDVSNDKPAVVHDVSPKPHAENTLVKSAQAPLKSVKVSPQRTQLIDEKSWQDVVDALKANHSTLYGLVRMAVPSFESDGITLEFTFPFHQKRLNEDRNKKIILAVVKDLTGQDIDIKCRLAEKKSTASRPVDKVVNGPSAVDNISNIFGSAEVLE